MHVCTQGEDLDAQQGVIDFSLYLRPPPARRGGGEDDSSESENGGGGGAEGGGADLAAALDQKNYVEELNRHLS